MLMEAMCRKGLKKSKGKHERKEKSSQSSKPKIRGIKIKKIKGQHPEKQMTRLKTKIQAKNEELEKRRNESRLKYPLDIRLYIATKV